MIVDTNPVNKEAKVTTISTKPEYEVDLQKVYYHRVYVLIQFNKEDGVDINQEHIEMEADLDKEEMEDMILVNGRERHWRMVYQENGGEIYDYKSLIHAKRWYLYTSEKI